MRSFINILFVLLVGSVHGADWYVDNTASGADDGTSWTDAWESLASIVYGGGGVVAGDTIYISGGSTSKTYTNRINMTVSHAEGSDMTWFRVGQDAGHNGMVIFDNQELNQSIIQNHTHSTGFDGWVGSSKRLMFANGFQARETGLITKDGASDFYFKGCIFTNAGIALVETGGKRGTVEQCEFVDIRGDAAIRLNSRNSAQTNQWFAAKDTVIRSNYFQLNIDSLGSGFGPDGIQGCNSLLVDGNVFNTAVGTQTWTPPESGQHTDFIQCGNFNMTIRNNEFLQLGDSAIDQDGSVIAGTGLGHLEIYNNLFWLTNQVEIPTAVRIYDNTVTVSGVTNVFIANNTFVDFAEGATYGAGTGIGGLRATNTYFENITFKNNLFANVGSTTKDVFTNLENDQHDINGWEFNYNAVWSGQSGTNSFLINGTTYSQANGQEGEPSFLSYAPLSANNDFHLSSGDTIALDNGDDLSAFFTTDKDGNTRSAPWDIGAYEFVPGVFVPIGQSRSPSVGIGVGNGGP